MRRRASDRPGLAAPAAGVAFAVVGFARAFRGPPTRFWERMTLNGAVLGTLALVAAPPRSVPRFRLRDLPIGLASAAALYGIFTVGDRLARRILPTGAADIEAVYALRGRRSAAELAARLAAVIGPAEELFWRGLLQGALAPRIGRWRAAAAANTAYAGVHLPSGNLTLAAAAATAGAFWSAMYAAGAPLGALIVSHVAWDLWIFLVAPTTRGAAVRSSVRDGRSRTHR